MYKSQKIITVRYHKTMVNGNKKMLLNASKSNYNVKLAGETS